MKDGTIFRLCDWSRRVFASSSRTLWVRTGLTFNEARVLLLLRQTPGVYARDLVSGTSLDKVLVSRALAKLNDAGYVHRTTNEHDRRCSVLHLSEFGKRVCDEIGPLLKSLDVPALSNAERSLLCKVLAHLDCNEGLQ